RRSSSYTSGNRSASALGSPCSIADRICVTSDMGQLLLHLVPPDVPFRVDVHPVARGEVRIPGVLGTGPVAPVAEFAVILLVLRDADHLQQLGVFAVDCRLCGDTLG